MTFVAELNEQVQLHPSYKIEHALRPKGIQTVCAIPIFENATEWEKRDPSDRSRPLAVVIFDTETNLKRSIGHQALEDVLASYAQIIGSTLTDNKKMLPQASLQPQRVVDFSELVKFGDYPGFYLAPRKERRLVVGQKTQDLIDRIWIKQRPFVERRGG
jgi:hypothetical protein